MSNNVDRQDKQTKATMMTVMTMMTMMTVFFKQLYHKTMINVCSYMHKGGLFIIEYRIVVNNLMDNIPLNPSCHASRDATT